MAQTAGRLIYRVSRRTHPNKLAAAIIGAVKDGREIDCLAIGGRALDNLIFALCIADRVLKGDVFCRFAFSDPEKRDSNFRVKATVGIG
ncbi:MAG: stage V sporulation protein S [Moorellaceae bacterium]